MEGISPTTRGKYKRALPVSESSHEQVIEVMVDLEARKRVDLRETIAKGDPGCQVCAPEAGGPRRERILQKC